MTYSTQHYGAGSPDCKICGGVGYVRYNVPDSDPRFGRIFDCECRADHSEEGLRKRAAASGVGDDGWKLEGDFWHLPGRAEMEKAAKEMAAGFAGGKCAGWLTLVSAFGLGKTAIGEWLAIQAIRAGRRALFLTAQQFGAAIGNSIDRDSAGDAGNLTRMATVDVLVFDQPEWVYDKHGSQSYGVNQLLLILNERYRQRERRATVLLANLAAYQARKESGLHAIWDRMTEGVVIISQAGGIRAGMGEVRKEDDK